MKLKVIGIGRWGEYGTEITYQVPVSETHNVTYVERVMPDDPEYARLDALKLYDTVEVSFKVGERDNVAPAKPAEPAE